MLRRLIKCVLQCGVGCVGGVGSLRKRLLILGVAKIVWAALQVADFCTCGQKPFVGARIGVF